MFKIEEQKNAAENTITINGNRFMVTDDIAQKIYSLCVGKTVKKSSSKKDDDEFPNLKDLGWTHKDTVGFFTRWELYDGKKIKGIAVRTWETGSYKSDKVKYALKKALTDAGAKWNNEVKAYTFILKKSADDFFTAQAEYQKSRK